VIQVAVVKVQFQQVAFHTASMDLGHWGAYAVEAPVMLSCDQIHQLVLRDSRHGTPS
jgi:hypothetical protein